MTTMTSQPAEIKMRSKFASKLPEDLKEVFINAVSYVNALKATKALEFLWVLTYNSEDALNRIGMTSLQSNAEDETFANLKFVPEELIVLIRNELRYQRKTMVDESFGEISVSDGIKDAFNAFYDATSQDNIISSIVLNACHLYVKSYNTSAVQRNIFLLSNEHENNYFGGLRSLNFSREEADYLKPFAHDISRLLAAMLEEEQEMSRNSPFECLGDMEFDSSEAEAHEVHEAANPVHATSFEEPMANIQTVVHENPVQEPLNAAKVVANAEVLGDFLKVCNRLKAANLDPMEVISKSDAVSKILDGISILG